jgi:hypothetical protein
VEFVMPFRLLLVSFLIILGGALSIPAAISIWQEREIQDEDNFVSTTTEVFENERVQEVLATRLTEVIMTRTDIAANITQGLVNLEERAGDNAPPGIPLLAAPITRLATDTIYDLCLRALQSDALNQILDTALRATHRAVMAVIDDDQGLLQESNGQIVLNLRPVIESVVQQLAGERGEEALGRLDIPEDAGMIVIRDEAQNPWIWKAAKWIDDFDPIIPIVTAVVFILAILVAKSRRRAIIAVGATLAIVAGLTLLALGAPVKELATSWPRTDEGQEAAKEAYDIILNSFRRQQFFTVILGLGMVLVASAAGDRRLAEAVRRSARREDGAVEGGFTGFVEERAVALRLAGLLIAGVVLVLWPDPDLRTVLTVGLLLVVYLGLIYLIASNDSWATSAREKLGQWMTGMGDEPVVPPSGFVGWVVRHAGLLRLLGIVVGAALVLFVWDLSLRGMVLIVAAELLYLAGIEWALASARGEKLSDEGA